MRPAESVCGPELNFCTCQRRGTIPRSQTEIDARHRASVARAIRSGWAEQPLPRWLVEMLDPAGLNPWRALPARERVA